MSLPSFRIRTLMVVVAIAAGVTSFIIEDQKAFRPAARLVASTPVGWGCGGEIRQQGDWLAVTCRLNVFSTDPGKVARWYVRLTDPSTGKVVFERTSDEPIPIPPGQPVRDTYMAMVRPGLPPGIYRYRIGLIAGRRDDRTGECEWEGEKGFASYVFTIDDGLTPPAR